MYQFKILVLLSLVYCICGACVGRDCSKNQQANGQDGIAVNGVSNNGFVDGVRAGEGVKRNIRETHASGGRNEDVKGGTEDNTEPNHEGGSDGDGFNSYDVKYYGDDGITEEDHIEEGSESIEYDYDYDYDPYFAITDPTDASDDTEGGK